MAESKKLFELPPQILRFAGEFNLPVTAQKTTPKTIIPNLTQTEKIPRTTPVNMPPV